MLTYPDFARYTAWLETQARADPAVEVKRQNWGESNRKPMSKTLNFTQPGKALGLPTH